MARCELVQVARLCMRWSASASGVGSGDAEANTAGSARSATARFVNFILRRKKGERKRVVVFGGKNEMEGPLGEDVDIGGARRRRRWGGG